MGARLATSLIGAGVDIAGVLAAFGVDTTSALVASVVNAAPLLATFGFDATLASVVFAVGFFFLASGFGGTSAADSPGTSPAATLGDCASAAVDASIGVGSATFFFRGARFFAAGIDSSAESGADGFLRSAIRHPSVLAVAK
jgi:hypothetical protein